MSGTPFFSKLLDGLENFDSGLEKLKRQTDIRFIPWKTLHNLREIAPLIPESYDILFSPPKKIADIGAADGDISFFLESNGHICDMYDYAAINWNGLRGARAIKQMRNSNVRIFDMDLNAQFSLNSEYDIIFLFGVLYHLKNPFYMLETCSTVAKYLFLSTRIAKRFRLGAPDVSTFPAAYLLGPDEANNDATNYWVFTEAGLRRLIERTGWSIIGYRATGSGDGVVPVFVEICSAGIAG